MMPNFPSHPTPSNSGVQRMSFWRGWLLQHPEVKTILELGRCDGRGSTWFFVESGADVWSVDILEFSPENNCATELLNYPNFYVIVADDTIEPIPEIDDRKFDLVFLDTSHQADHTKYELERYYPLARKWFCVDDWHWGESNPVLQQFSSKWKFLGGIDIYGIDVESGK